MLIAALDRDVTGEGDGKEAKEEVGRMISQGVAVTASRRGILLTREKTSGASSRIFLVGFTAR